MRRPIALVGLLALSSVASALPPCAPQQMLAPDGVGFAWFGCAVALDGDTMLVGAFRDSELFGSGGAAYVRRWDGSAWEQEAKLQPLDGAANDEFGYVVALDRDTAVIGSWQSDGPGGADQGAVYIFVRSPGGSTWTQQAKLLASDGAAGDRFGHSVALRGDELLIGASLDDGGAGADQGSAYVFTRIGVEWTQRAKLEPADPGAGDNFGRSVALGAGTALIGAPFDDGTGGIDEGAAYAFVGSGASWTQEAKLTAVDNAVGDWFGRAVVIDGDRAAICALFDDGPGATDDGSVTVFTRAGGVWTQQQKLFGENGDSSDWFGYSIALSGGTLLIGRPQGDFNDANHKGGAREYRWTGSSWELSRKLDPPGMAFGDYYGMAVALDGDTAVCGAGGDFVAAENQGSLWIFRRSGGEWFEPDYGLITGSVASDALGTSVDLDGDTMAIGVPGHDDTGGSNQGSVRIFVRDGLLWTLQQTVIAGDGALNDAFGTSVSLDGDTLTVGAPLDSVGGGTNQGSAYVFVRSAGVWTQQQKLLASDRATGDNFGWSISVSGDRLIVGAPGANAPVTDSGAAYAFVRSAGVWSQQDKLTATDAGGGDAFGSSVALDGLTAVIGANLDNVIGTDDGSAYIFAVPSGGTDWTQRAKLTASDSATNGFFGDKVAIDGDVVLAGAFIRSETFAPSIGAAYVFRKQETSGLWSQEAKLQPSDGVASDYFGRGVALDGDLAAIGANDDNFLGFKPGAVYLFERVGGVWGERHKLLAAGGAAGDWFGGSVALDGGTLLVGARGDDTGVGALFVDRGSVQTFCVREECLPVVVENAAESSVHGTLSAAMSAATPFDVLESNASAFWETGSLDAMGLPLFLESSGGVRQPREQSLTLGAGSMLASAAGDVLDFYGSTIFGGVTLSTASAVRNFGTMALSGTIDGDLVNERTLVAPASLTVYGDVLNRGAITIESGTLTIIGALTDEGTIVGDLTGGRPAQDVEGEESPSEASAAAGGVSARGGYAASASANLSLPTAGARFTCGGAFDCAINDRARYDLRSAELRMNGADAPQALEAMSADIGAVLAGLDRSQPGRFPIGTLRIGPGAAAVTVVDARDNDNAGQAAGEAVYVETLIIESGASLTAPTHRVYYKTLVNNGGTITTPAGVILIPPFCAGNANGDGVVDFDDITEALASWQADYTPETGPGDANGDGLVNFDDITEVLANWGADCL